MNFEVWYMKPSFFRDGIFGKLPDHTKLEDTHVMVKSLTTTGDLPFEGLSQVMHEMQGEVWSPNGEARDLIRSLGLEHTSMSVGDVAIDESGYVWLARPAGWSNLGKRPGPLKSLYVCWAKGHARQNISAEFGLDARKEYARRIGHADTREVISRRIDLVDAKFDRLTSEVST